VIAPTGDASWRVLDVGRLRRSARRESRSATAAATGSSARGLEFRKIPAEGVAAAIPAR